MASIQQHNQVIVLLSFPQLWDFPIVHWSNLIRGSWSTWASDSTDKVRVWSESDREKLQCVHSSLVLSLLWLMIMSVHPIFNSDLTSWSWVLWCYLYFDHQYLFQILCDKDSKAKLDRERERLLLFLIPTTNSVADMLLPRNAGSQNIHGRGYQQLQLGPSCETCKDVGGHWQQSDY